MLTRRKFLQSSAAAAAVSTIALSGKKAWAAKQLPLGVQLYTVRNLAEGDLASVLKQVRGIGYDEVETYWNVYTHPAPTLRKMISDAGLRVPSGHFDYDGLSGKFDYAKELGVQWMVCPMLPQGKWDSIDIFHIAAKQFNEWGKRAKDLGMRFAFHNHDYEFRSFNGTTGYDVLLKETDPELVFFEMDCYWITQSGHDPVQMMQKLGPRVRMIHLKDRKPGFPSSYDMKPSSMHVTEVGHGSIQWKAVLQQAEQQGIEHYFVEQDETPGNPVASIQSSYRYLRTILS